MKYIIIIEHVEEEEEEEEEEEDKRPANFPSMKRVKGGIEFMKN